MKETTDLGAFRESGDNRTVGCITEDSLTLFFSSLDTCLPFVTVGGGRA